MNLIEMLLGSMTSESSVNALAEKTGGSNKQMYALIIAAIPLLIKFLTKNAKKDEGANSLLGALGQHKSSETAAKQIKEADEEDGAKILAHILGKDQGKIVKELSRDTGLSTEQVLKALANLAPATMSGLSSATTTASKQKKSGVDLSDGLDLTDIMAMMGGQQKQEETSGAGGLLGALLGGGQKKQEASPMDLLGGLFGAQQQEQQSTSMDLLGSLLGGGQQKKSEIDGTALLKMLTSLM